MARLAQRVAVLALGCPKNRVDSEHILGTIALAGYHLTSDPAQADIAILTTCAFIKPAVAESEASIRQLLRLKRRKPSLKIVVAGCLVQRFGPLLSRQFPDVDLWVGLDHLTSIPKLLSASLRGHPRPLQTAAFRPPHSAFRTSRILSTPKHYAYIKIADGCDNRCSYCTIPDIRGPFRSRPISDIVGEAERLARLGVRELILIAQDTTLYGKDLYRRPALAKLLCRLSRIPAITWLRLMYAHPAHLTEDVIEEFESNPKLCRYIDLPIQHISDPILERMNRPYRCRDIEKLLLRLRSIPDLHIRTTIITGFPGETEKEFQELLDFISEARFDRLSGYAYYPEPGTPASRLQHQVRPELRRLRLRRIIQAQANVSRSNLRRLIGRELPVIVDAPGIGRTQWDAPEIDGVVKLASPTTRTSPPPGHIVRCRITRAWTHDLAGQPLYPSEPPCELATQHPTQL